MALMLGNDHFSIVSPFDQSRQAGSRAKKKTDTAAKEARKIEKGS